jgi:hypothetical protein
MAIFYLQTRLLGSANVEMLFPSRSMFVLMFHISYFNDKDMCAFRWPFQFV